MSCQEIVILDSSCLQRSAIVGFCRGRQIVLNILHGLEYLHGLEIAHLGLRSHDILLDKEGQAKIGSVGLGRLVGAYGTLATAAGSPLWAAPEQINGEVGPHPVYQRAICAGWQELHMFCCRL